MGDPPKSNSYINKIVDKYIDMLFRIALLHTKNRADAEDVVQDVLIKFINICPAFKSDEHEKAWLIRTAINQSRDLLKSSWFKKTRPLFDEHILTFAPEQNEVLTAVMELPQKYKGVIILFYYEGYSISEIAKILGQKESTIGSQLNRARKMLKMMLNEESKYEEG